MTHSKRTRNAAAGNPRAVGELQGPGPEHQFIRLRPALRARELTVMNAVAALPAECRTPTAAATALMLGGIGIPYSSLASILRRLERKGAIQLGRVKS